MSGARVLVVDDEPDILDLLSIWFGDDDRCAMVDRASTLDACVELASQRQPDAIVLDFWFGARSSIEVLPSLRRDCPDSVIVVHTASRRAALSEGVLAHGADEVIEKASITIDEVVDRVLELATTSRGRSRVVSLADRRSLPGTASG